MKWRLIEQKAYPAAMNMAIDHFIYESVASGQLPTIRFYKWLNSSVSISFYQNSHEINLEACRRHNIDLVRRMTGGRAVFHDKADFTYSVVAPIRVFNYNIKTAYKEICFCIIKALKELGIKASLENKNDIVVGGKKISGNAAKAMDKGVYLQHGTLVYGIDMDVMPEVLGISRDLAEEKITSVLQHKKITQEKAYGALRNSFVSGKDFIAEELSKQELAMAQNLAITRYGKITLPKSYVLRNKGICYVER